ncbi:phytanoyl-CoA dioxygenase family protein [Amycolatopsis magusensis]|uniref:Ectoine hydroxylase-related dioxygenase, phytanoyl-CoA dioxygenase (PhyH) family n=1 Tax=Amycolatopsis magusensis TaxID=882444 RepID=A0ABS4PLX8_9PSEU|nr:phytanoyl-CoA dioxygenase family protein [Amycolatopsis magusensis]MBP2180436.1 hypothetical protein [Amycolatopsis magusensis]MDI5982616.1 phytanoyl-CoA dioxygenase family protein [Amycolatopsis magusensis]
MGASLTRFGPDADPAEVAETLETDGGAIVTAFAGKSMLDGLWADLQPVLESGDYGADEFSGHRTKRIASLFARAPRLAELVVQPVFLDTARKLIERPVKVWFGEAQASLAPNVQISASQVIQIWPGEGEQPLHRDDSSHLIPYPAPIRRVQMMLALSEFTAENGGTLVIPGSHRWDDEQPPKLADAIATEMEPGSALLWVGGTYHGGGRNTAETPRTGLTVSMVAGNMRQEENQYLAVPREIVREYPEQVRRLLGYNTCPPFLGWHESADPYHLVADPVEV